MSAHGKRYRAARESIDREEAYTPLAAVRLLKDSPAAKFDETVEVHFRLGLNVRHADEQLRGTIMLPHGIGKDVRVAVFAEGEKAREAEDAGADIVGSGDLATKIEGGFLDFDVAIATPDQMSVVGKLGRVLGPRGLMPNPKTGTVTMDVDQGRFRREGRQAGVPHRPWRQRPPSDRQAELRRARVARELRRPRRGDRPGQAVRREGPLHPADHAHDDNGPGHPRRFDHHSRHRRGAGGSYSLGLATNDSRRRPSAALHERRSDRGRFRQRVQRPTEPAVSGFRRSGGNDVLKTDKERIVEELAAELGSAETLIVADYRGLTNKQLEALRDQLLPHGARFRIVKNTLTRRAAEQAGADALLVMLEGPTAIAFIESSGDPAAVAKALAATAKETNVLTLRGGMLEGKSLTGEEVDRLATLPPLDVLRGQLVGAIVAPITQLLALVSAPLRDLHGLIDARIAQLEEQGEVVGPVAEAAVETAEPATEEAEQSPPAAEEGLSAAEPQEARAPEDSAAADAADPEPEDTETTNQAEDQQEEEDNGN